MRKHHNEFHFYQKQSVTKHLCALPLKHKSRDEILEIAVRYLRAKHDETKKKGRTAALFPVSNRISFPESLSPWGVWQGVLCFCAKILYKCSHQRFQAKEIWSSFFFPQQTPSKMCAQIPGITSCIPLSNVGNCVVWLI